MSFRPVGAALPARFKKSNDNTTFRQYPRDRLVVVDKYELESGTMYATDVRTGHKLEVRISKEKASIPVTQAGVKYNGNLIDERLAEVIPVGNRCRLEATKVDKKFKRGNEDVYQITANWVRSLPSQDPEKAFVGWYSVSAYDNRITGVQHVPDEWRTAIRPSTPEGEAQLQELGQEMDRLAAEYRAGKHPITLGVCFRTMVQIDEREKDGKKVPVYQIIDTTPPFDWEAAEYDGDRNVIKEGSPVTSRFMEDNLEGYLDYVYGSQDQSKEDAFPGLRAAGILKEGQEPIVEIEVYRSLATSRLSDRLSITNQRSPLYSLANVMTKYSLTDPHGYVGKNWMVEGIVVLTEDKRPESKGGEWVERNLVTDLMVNGPRANFHLVYHAADGGIVEIHPGLDRVLEQRAEDKKENTAAATTSQAAPALSAAEVNLDEGDVSENFFAVSAQQSIEQADAAPVQEDEAPFEEAPAQPEAPAAAPASSSTTQGAAGRFRRST